MTLRRRVLSAAQIEGLADAFRAQHAPGNSGPLDIEVILEHDLGITIIPQDGLLKETRKKGWLSCTGRRIVVDQGLMLSSPDEYRYLVAEEGGHSVLHSYLLPPTPFANEAEWRKWHAEISKEEEFWLEWQARTWAGRVLVPRGELRPVFERARADARRVFRSYNLCEMARTLIESEVAAHFGISPHCAHVRIDQDGLWGTTGAIKLAG